MFSCNRDKPSDQLSGTALSAVCRKGVDTEKHLPFALFIVQSCVFIHFIGQVTLIRHKSVHKSNEPVIIKHQQEMVCAVESITYPLVLLLNKINGASYSDQPETAERRDCSTMIINSDEDLAKFEHSIYLTFQPEDAFLTPEEVLNLTAYANPDATYAGLCEILDHMTIEDLK